MVDYMIIDKCTEMDGLTPRCIDMDKDVKTLASTTIVNRKNMKWTEICESLGLIPNTAEEIGYNSKYDLDNIGKEKALEKHIERYKKYK